MSLLPCPDRAAASGPSGPGAVAARFIEGLAGPADTLLPADGVAVVVAHPDDEAIGVGGQLARMPGVTVIHLTDGAPQRPGAWRNGHASLAAYREQRGRELDAALDIVAIPRSRRIRLGCADQAAWSHLVELTIALTGLLATIDCRIVLTHPYEGGHPDHDAAAFAVHQACAALARRGAAEPTVIEMACYHQAAGRAVRQRFAPRSGPPHRVVRLDPDQRAIKRRMFAAHASQSSILAELSVAQERYRRAPAYGFDRLPNNGEILYESFGWGMDGAGWIRRAAVALERLADGDAADLDAGSTSPGP